MNNKKLSRRDFLRLSAVTGASIALAGCASGTESEAAKSTEAPASAAPEKEPIVLEIGSSNPEYENAEAQIWALYEAENPNVKIEMFSVNEDEEAATFAKIAGGWTPAIAPDHYLTPDHVTPDNYEMFVDLTTIEFPYWDRFTHDPLHKVPELFGHGPRCLHPFKGHIFTWQFHGDLMDQAGLDPRKDVKTWDDIKTWLAAGTKWASENPDIEYFWDLAWHGWAIGDMIMRVIPLAFPDGQQADVMECYMGRKKFNDASSPFRHTFEFFKEAYDEGWVPKNWWTREWEADMEANYISKKSVMMLHGPWVWDKAISADPTVQQLGLPATPPAEGQDVWMQFMGKPDYNEGYACMLKAAENLPYYDEIVKAFVWYHSPEVIKMRAEVLGRDVLYDLGGDVLELTGPQWLGVTKDIGTPGGLWEDVQYTTDTWGNQAADKYKVGGSPGVFDAEGTLVEKFAALSNGDMTVQEILDWAQANYEESYPELAG